MSPLRLSSSRAIRAPAGRVALLLLLLAATSAGGPVAAQECESFPAGSPQARYVEWARKHYPRLCEPDFAELKLRRSPPEKSLEPRPPDPPFAAGTPVWVFLLIRNNSGERIYWPFVGRYIHTRPQLSNGGQLIPYKSDVDRLVQRNDVYPSYHSARFENLEPRQTRTEYINLADWYEPLEPGRYSLVLRHRFIWGGRWLDSPPLDFEVATKEADAPADAASTTRGPTGAKARTPGRPAARRRP